MKRLVSVAVALALPLGVVIGSVVGNAFEAPAEPRELAAAAGSTSGAGNVTVYRDEFGVPHIYGETAEAAAYGLGYVQAQDHLERMRLNYLTAAGRLAEFGLGSPSQDSGMYLLHVPQTAQATYEALVPEHRSRIDAFVAGINQYVFEQAGSLPDWVVYVEPYEVLAWAHYLAMVEQRSIATSEMNADGGGAGVEGEAASNMWAVSPSLSTLGVAMLNGDPHLPWTGFTRQWYEAHLNYPGANVAGSLFFGFPAIVMGANDNVAWTMTNNGADTADVYAETVNPGDPFQYLRDGSWVNVQSETVTVKEKVGDDIVDRSFTNYYSVHGPLIGTGPGVYYAAAMASFDNVTDRFPLFDANEATSIDLGLDPNQPPDMHKWNIITADRSGNIGYVWNIRVAQKPESIDWSQPVDGSTSANDWGPFLTRAQLPQTRNPSWGYLQNANNPAWTTAPDLNPDDYPSYVGGSRSGWLGDRGTRAVEILESRSQHSIQDMITMAFDSLSVRARLLIPVVVDVWAEVGPTTPDPGGNLQAAIDLLSAWDFVQGRESPKTALGRLFIDTFYQANPGFSATNVPPADQWTQADKDKMVGALQQATDFMLANIGQLDPLWGDVHKIQRGAQVFRVGGGNKGLPALHMANASLFQNGVWWASSGSSYIFVAAFTDPITFYSVRPLGQSEDPSSPHFADQTQLFADEQLKQVWMTLADVQAHAESSFSLIYDGDGVPDGLDNCPLVANPGQENTDAERRTNGAVPGDWASNPDGDPLGDACDDNRDNDWMLDSGTHPTLGTPGEDVGCGSGPTDPLMPDSDGDRVVDGAECLLGSDPNDPDSKPPGVPAGDGDRDGLPASVEGLFGSSDASMDSDGDGFTDGWEVKGYGTSPVSVDSDGDGCADWIEMVDVNGNRKAELSDVFAIILRALAGGAGDAEGDAVLDLNKNGVVINDLGDVFLAILNSDLVRDHGVCGPDAPW